MQQSNITFIGAGNMAQSLIGGLLANHFPAQQIWASDPSLQRLAHLQANLGIAIEQDNVKAAQHADVVVLAVKPQTISKVAEEIQVVVKERKPLVISIAAGISLQSLERYLGKSVAIVRCMPNTPALVRAAATGLCANANVTEAQKALAETVLTAVGICLWFDKEEQLDIVTALSGSGPAYFLYFMEALEEGALALGLDPKAVHLLTLQTALGTAQLVKKSNDSLLALRQKVTSPGGTTEQAIKIFDTRQLRTIVKEAVQAAQQRSKTLAIELGKDHA